MITITIKVNEDESGNVLVDCDNVEAVATNKERSVANALSVAARDEFQEILNKSLGGFVKVQEIKSPPRGIKPEDL